ncbi:MAG: hypothetical protein AB1656_12980 [Candidatus Omnitrophota bacterium]
MKVRDDRKELSDQTVGQVIAGDGMSEKTGRFSPALFYGLKWKQDFDSKAAAAEMQRRSPRLFNRR